LCTKAHQHRTSQQHGIGHHEKSRMSVDQLANAGFEVARSRLPHLQTKASQDAPKAHLQVVALALYQLARRQYRTQFLGRQ
jgi:hypothetical protein